MNKPIEVSKATYLAIEKHLEQWYNSKDCPWSRMFVQGKRLGKSEVIKRFDLECIEEVGDRVLVRLVSKDNPEHVPFEERFYKYL